MAYIQDGYLFFLLSKTMKDRKIGKYKQTCPTVKNVYFSTVLSYASTFFTCHDASHAS